MHPGTERGRPPDRIPRDALARAAAVDTAASGQGAAVSGRTSGVNPGAPHRRWRLSSTPSEFRRHSNDHDPYRRLACSMPTRCVRQRTPCAHDRETRVWGRGRCAATRRSRLAFVPARDQPTTPWLVVSDRGSATASARLLLSCLQHPGAWLAAAAANSRLKRLRVPRALFSATQVRFSEYRDDRGRTKRGVLRSQLPHRPEAAEACLRSRHGLVSSVARAGRPRPGCSKRLTLQLSGCAVAACPVLPNAVVLIVRAGLAKTGGRRIPSLIPDARPLVWFGPARGDRARGESIFP